MLQKDCLESEGCEIERLHTHSSYIKERAFLERVARRAVHPRKPYGVCAHCGKDTREEIDKKYSKKVARKMAEYNILLELCKEKGYLNTSESKDEETGHPITYIRPSNKANEMTGLMDLIEILLTQYKLTWTFILIPVVTFGVGIFVSPSFIRIIRNWF